MLSSDSGTEINMFFTPDFCENSYGSYLREILSDLHQHPELSMKEYRTTKKIHNILEQSGIEIIELGTDTGLVGKLEGQDGPSIGLRADIDAIPQHEQSGRTDCSLTDGIMHGCGHDTHTVSLLGAAMLLSSYREKLKGDVYFIFQPAEETLSGARYLIDQCNLFKKIHLDAIFGLHNYPEIPVGTVGVRSGQLMSYKDAFTIRFIGRSGHSSMPQKNIDPIVAAAAFVQSSQTIVSRNVGPLDSAVISICQMHAGTPNNLIVDEVFLSGNIRTLNPDVRTRVLQRFEQLAKGIADAYECRLDMDCHPIVPGVNNCQDMFKLAHAAAAATFGSENIMTPPVNLASEDFSIYGQYAPSFFYFLGSGRPGETVYSWHNAKFYPDENTPVCGAALLANSVIEAQEHFKKSANKQL